MRPGRDLDDAGLAVHRSGDDAGLRAGERLGLEAQRVDRHGQQRHRDALAGAEEHVELPARRHRDDLLGELDQLVGGVAHGRDDDGDVVAGLLGVDDAFGDPLDPLGVGDGGAAVFLHDETHGGPLRRCRRKPQDTGRPAALSSTARRRLRPGSRWRVSGRGGERRFEDVQALVQQVVADDQRRQEAQHVAVACRRSARSGPPGGRRRRPCAVRAGFGRVLPGSTSSRASIAPRPRTSPTASYLSASAVSRGSMIDSMRCAAAGEVLGLHGLDRGQRGGAGDRVAAVGAAEPAGVHGVHHLGAAGDRRRAAGRRRCPWPW